MLRSQLLHAEIARLRHAYVTPGEFALLTLGGASKAKAACAALRIECGQTECALHARIALETHHERFARALAIGVAGYEAVGARKGARRIAAAASALGIAKVANGAAVAVAARIALAALALTADCGALLANGANVIAFAFTTAQTRLPAPGARHALGAAQAAREFRTNAASIERITDLTLCRACGTALAALCAKAKEALGALVAMPPADPNFAVTLTRPRIALVTACAVRIALAVVTAHALCEIPVTRLALVAAPTRHIQQAGALARAFVACRRQRTNRTALAICKKYIERKFELTWVST